jgi:hypothetical protein
MIIIPGEKFHVVMRRNYESQVQRHFINFLAITDGKGYQLDINEFGTRR